jgi:hypothetical protein
MQSASNTLYPNSGEPNSVFLALREFLHQHPEAVASGPETLAELLYERRFLPHRLEVFEVEVALEALRVEGEVLP